MTEKPHIGYVVKVYPRYSETFIVTEILAREAAGEKLSIFSLRPTTDARFQPEIARVQAPVHHVGKPHKLSDAAVVMAAAERVLPDFGPRFGALMPWLVRFDPVDVLQGVEVATAAADAGIDHLHAHFASVQARVAWLAAKLLGISFSVTTHAKDIFHKSIDREVLALILRDADQVITISDYNHAYLREQFGELGARVTVVRNGLELERFPFTAPDEVGQTLNIAAVGRLVAKKGFAVLIDAVSVATGAGLRCRVRIAGDGELRRELQTQIIANGLVDTVELIGPRSQTELQELMNWADVMVVPSVNAADGNAEGLPTVLLEAMARGVPCIASAVTGIPEAIWPAENPGERTGTLVPPGDPAALATALIAAADPSHPRMQIAANARRLIETEYDSRRQAAKLAALQTITSGREAGR
ncbi:glycosyltransferase family 4 protein [Naumannella halotolerans]|uniref:Glycosyltransferase involved in cell wall biosynthesis n=1 Tax=Naumannella halotolerans TaxID=993414 RepID=A0A4R7JAF7_9ACTN|nr:glycosyltransferase family 4 protein [Naumannella halotolerans]TDT34355.1 glycosyltransferase involved in cell wall biosynthesis [Naumannella halotolerans]